MAKASAKFTEVLKEHKIDTRHQAKLENYVLSQMSPDEVKKFTSGDFKIAEEIFKKEFEDGIFSSIATKATAPKLPKRNPAGGTGAQGKGAKPTTLKEAEEAAWAKMSERA